MDDAGRNILFYAVKEALPQLTAFLLGALDVFGGPIKLFRHIEGFGDAGHAFLRDVLGMHFAVEWPWRPCLMFRPSRLVFIYVAL